MGKAKKVQIKVRFDTSEAELRVKELLDGVSAARRELKTNIRAGRELMLEMKARHAAMMAQIETTSKAQVENATAALERVEEAFVEWAK